MNDTLAAFKNELTIVVRTAEERTEAVCMDLMRKLHSENNVFRVQEKPFAKALEKSFNIGLQQGKKWLLCNDADVLPSPFLLDFLSKEVAAHQEDVFEYHTRVFDKFYGGIRPGGIKLYNTKALDEALKMIPNVYKSTRPESDVIRKMQQNGYKKIGVKRISGVHDYEQYYKHLYMKGFSHARKHAKQMKIFYPYWKRMAAIDKDFTAALQGLKDGRKKSAQKPDTQTASKVIQHLNMVEKGTLQSVSFSDVMQLFRLNDEPPEYYQYLKHIRKSRKKHPLGFIKKYFHI